MTLPRTSVGLVGLVLLAAALRAGASEPAPVDPERGLHCREESNESCFAYAAPGGARMRAAPRADARTLSTMSYGSMVLLLSVKPEPGAPDWLPARTAIEGRVFPAWVRRREVVLASDFHRVVGCWPVKSMRWQGPLGDEGLEHMPYQLDFDTDGSIRWPEKDGGMMIDRASVVWYAQGLFRFAPPGDPSNAFTTTFILRRGAGGTTVGAGTGRDPAPQLRATFRGLTGCGKGPTVDPSSSLAGP